MAIPAAVIGALKVALKTAAKKAAQQVAKEAAKQGTKAAVKAAAKSALETIGKKAMTDTQAIILNRLKSAPNKVLFEFASKELGLPVKEVKQVVKLFKQSPKMREISVGKEFKKVAQAKLKKELKLDKADKIKDIVRKANEYNKKKEKEEREKEGGQIDYSKEVKSLLKQIEAALTEKVHGISTAETKERVEKKFNTKIEVFFDENRKYNLKTIFMLEQILNHFDIDIERYEIGSSEELTLTEYAPRKWRVNNESSLIQYINEVKEDTSIALSIED